MSNIFQLPGVAPGEDDALREIERQMPAWAVQHAFSLHEILVQGRVDREDMFLGKQLAEEAYSLTAELVRELVVHLNEAATEEVDTEPIRRAAGHFVVVGAEE